jgi:hypothetical protein
MTLKIPNTIPDNQYKARLIFSHFRGLQTQGLKRNFFAAYLRGKTRRKRETQIRGIGVSR